MPLAFEIQRVAIHFVDKKGKKLTLSPDEIDLASYAPDDQKIIHGFLSEHLARSWGAEVAGKTRAASFADGSAVQAAYQTLTADSSGFFQSSRDLAERLYRESPPKASPGLLMVLWFEVPGTPGPFLGLFKLEPGERDQVALKSKAGRFLLDLAVERIQWALPEPDRVLKWALVPHPPAPTDEPQFALKIRDLQSGTDPAVYFTEGFLGCAPKPNPRQQLGAALDALGAHAEKAHPDKSWKPGIKPLIEALGQERVITADALARQVKKHVLPDLDEAAFQKELEAVKAGDMRVNPALVQGVKLRYDLPGDIRIEGPIASMAAVVIEEKADRSVEFRIPTTRGYKTKVIL